MAEANPGRKRSHFFSSFFDGCTDKYNYNEVKRWSVNVPGKDICALDKVFFMHNVDGSNWRTCAVIFIEEKIIVQRFNGYLKDEWFVKKGGELPDADKKWRIVLVLWTRTNCISMVKLFYFIVFSVHNCNINHSMCTCPKY